LLDRGQAAFAGREAEYGRKLPSFLAEQQCSRAGLAACDVRETVYEERSYTY
jgi:hypothetical protein